MVRQALGWMVLPDMVTARSHFMSSREAERPGFGAYRPYHVSIPRRGSVQIGLKKMLKRLACGAAAVGLFVALAACAQQSRSDSAMRGSLLASGTPGWRVMQTLPGLAEGGLWAGGARDAWLAGDTCADQECGEGDGSLAVWHWDGRLWRAARPPAAYVNATIDQGAGPVAGTSPVNVWVTAYRGAQSVDWTDLLHWTGRGWAAPVRVPAVVQAVIAPSATQLWAFGPGTAGRPGYVAHLAGRTWTSGSFPLDGTAAAALSATDVWAGGITATGEPGIEHWDGRDWRPAPLPGLGLGRPPRFGLTVGIAAAGPDDIWADISDLSSSPSNRPATFLLHWNGRNWARAPFPFSGLPFAPVTVDGHGGLWLALEASGKQWFYHYGAGRCTKTPVPDSSMPQYMAWIPGTTSQWALGDPSNGNVSTVVLKYGP
jgi:hypothetical protein